MTKLSDKSLVKKFAKGDAVSVELGGTPENAVVNEKLLSSVLREKHSTEAERVSSHLSEAMLQR